MRSIVLFAIIFVSAIFLSPQAKATELPLSVVVSIAPQKWIIEQIAGAENVSVTVMVRPGSDAHSYEPTPSQMKKIAQAKTYFTIGLPFETIWLPRFTTVSNELSTCSMIAGVTPLKHDSTRVDTHSHHEHKHHDIDPHTWLDPLTVKLMIPLVEKELIHQMPDKADLFAENAKTLAQKLEKIDARIKEDFSQVPLEKRNFLTFHPAWKYFAHRYSLRELTIEVEGKEPSPKAMKNIIDLSRKYHITTVFSEPQFPKSAVQAVAENIHAKIVTADPLAENLLDTWNMMAKQLLKSWKE